MPNLVMLVGLPYSGKSTCAKSLGIFNDYVLVSSDQEVHNIAAENNTTYNQCFNEVADLAMKRATEKLLQALKDKKDILIDQTNLTKASRRRKLSQVPSGYKKTCIVVPLPTDEEMVIRKQERTTHSVPDKVLENMKQIYQEPTLDEGFDIIYKAGFDDIVITN